MRFLVDAQLPRRIAAWLTAAGHDAAHVSELPAGNRTLDPDVSGLADRDDRVVVTKDSDFVDTHLLRGTPARLLLITTGNITNRKLEELLRPRLDEIVAALEASPFVEFGVQGIEIRG